MSSSNLVTKFGFFVSFIHVIVNLWSQPLMLLFSAEDEGEKGGVEDIEQS